MAVITEVLEMRGMKRTELVNYFTEIGTISTEDGSYIKSDGWEVVIGDESKIRLGSLEVTSTIVEFRVDQNLLEPFLKKFRLKFLSAGG